MTLSTHHQPEKPGPPCWAPKCVPVPGTKDEVYDRDTDRDAARFWRFCLPPARSSLRRRPPASLKTGGIPPPPQVKNGRDPADPPLKTGKTSSPGTAFHDGDVKQWDLFIVTHGGGMPIVARHSRHTPTYPVPVGGMALVPDGGGGHLRVLSTFPDRRSCSFMPKREFRMAAETCKEKINRLIVRIPPSTPGCLPTSPSHNSPVFHQPRMNRSRHTRTGL